MGRMQADEFGSLVAEGSLDLSVALTWHLGSNHYPPVLFMLDAANDAIEAGNDEDFDRMISLPGGVRYKGATEAPARDLIEHLHLEEFLS